jgi:hypothetical protein
MCEGLAGLAGLGDFLQFYVVFVASVVLVEDQFGHVDGFLFGYAVLEDADDVGEADVAFVVHAFEEDFHVVGDVLLEDDLVDFVVHL